LPPFIVTLGMWQIVLAPISSIPPTRPSALRTSRPTRRRSCSFSATRFKIGGAVFTYGAIFMVLLVLLLAYVLKQTAWGRHVYAVGDDPEAAELSGVNVKRTLISVYMLAGLICAFAGWALIGPHRLGLADLGQLGNIESITAVVIGGISLFRRARLDPGRALRRADRRRLLAGPAAARRRRAMDLPADRRAHHRRRRRRPVDQKGVGMMEPILKGATSSSAMAASPPSIIATSTSCRARSWR
jgi:hypothetical protein